MSYEDIGISKVDIDRKKIKGFPEIIYGEYKTAKQIISIMKTLIKHEQPVLVTRIDEQKAEEITKVIPDSCYRETARLLTLGIAEEKWQGKIAVVCAGTADLFVAEEAKLTAEWMGCHVQTYYDVGVAGISRLFAVLDEIRSCQVVIVIAGMEGALPSVVSGLTDAPVIAVPTSVGYGSNLEGVTTLLAMLSSCSSGISVVNIDNGFGAAYQAALILRQISQQKG